MKIQVLENVSLPACVACTQRGSRQFQITRLVVKQLIPEWRNTRN